ncbi:hypothetical protein JOB18_033164 [Solea senegalensis]|uniref:Uncharacterized protein n=1 Tax=Solea senegalensis TaxID=28829 RepID=A0AAV6PPI4_SOLSE|nr:hypothetical protein JOB18_033164 [Solea senegalensis]
MWNRGDFQPMAVQQERAVVLESSTSEVYWSGGTQPCCGRVNAMGSSGETRVWMAVLKNHMLLFHLPQQQADFGFDLYEQLPAIREKRLQTVLGLQNSGEDKGD